MSDHSTPHADPESAERTRPARKRRLGRGLGSLISTPVAVDTRPAAPEDPPPAAAGASDSTPSEGASGPDAGRGTFASPDVPRGTSVCAIPLDAIVPSRSQPRQHFDEVALLDLAESIRQAGVMQPILVRPRPGEPYRFEIIAGERRWRAAHMVQIETIPALVADLDDRAAAEWALIENIQREDLNPLEQAEGFAALVEQYGLSHQDLADRMGISRSAVTNTLRLNELDRESKDLIRTDMLSLGHAKVLLGIADRGARGTLAKQAAADGWSVRELEKRIQDEPAPGPERPGSRAIAAGSQKPANPHLRDLEERLGNHLGTRVHIREGRRKGTGKVIIEFYSLDEFDGILHQLGFGTT